jgi:hypothetical protein
MSYEFHIYKNAMIWCQARLAPINNEFSSKTAVLSPCKIPETLSGQPDVIGANLA